jgi:hypothetical protein
VLLLGFGITVEVAEQAFSVFVSPICKVADERFNLISGGVAERGYSAVISGVGFHETGVESVLADQEAEAVAQTRLTIVMTIAVASGRVRPRRSRRFGVCDSGRPAEFLDRAQTDAVGLAEGTVDSAGLGNAHLGAVDQGRDVRGISVAIADKAVRTERFVDRRFENPTAKTRVGESFLKKRTDSEASAPESYLKEPGIGHVPPAIDVQKFPLRKGET